MRNVVVVFSVLFSAVAHAQKTASELWAEVSGLDHKDKVAWYDSRSKDDIRVLADDVLQVASTNMAAAGRIGGCVIRSIFMHWAPAPANDLAEEYDMKFKAGPYCGTTHYWKLAPKTTLAYLASTNASEYVVRHPAFVALIRYGCENGALPDDIAFSANVLVENAAVLNRNANYHSSLDSLKKRILNKAPRVVRHELRKRGLPITVRDGVNPLQDAIDDLTSALNAPRMSGVKEWFAKWCPEYQWIDVQWESDEWLAKFKDDIFYGDIDFNASARFRLCAYLGVDEYNKFVKVFNCEK